MTASSSIQVGLAPSQAVWVRVCGKGSFQNSWGVKDFSREMMNRGHRDFTVDLADCAGMDSTFMGVLTGLALRLRQLGEGVLRVVNANERNRDSLTGLGLDQILTLEEKPVAPPCATEAAPALNGAPQAKRDLSSTMLEAHEALCSANGANVGKFKDVLEFLREDLRRTDPAAGSR